MKNQILVISFGNYETKILVGAKFEKEIILYTNSFSSQSLIVNSFILNKDLLIKKLELVFDDIKKQLGYLPTKVIYNIPLDNLEIREKKSSEYSIKNQNFDYEYWNKIYDEVKINNSNNKKFFCLGKKVTRWILNGTTYHSIPFDKKGNLVFYTQLFLIPKKDVNCYLELFDDLNFSNYEIVTDEIVMNNALERNKYIEQVIVNIGDKKTTISLYYNHSLVKIADYDLGIKDMTSKISAITKVNEEEAIKMLKNYEFYNILIHDSEFTKLRIDENSLPFSMGDHEKIMKFETFNLSQMNLIIKNWIIEVGKIINQFSIELKKSSLDIEEIYIYTVTNIFKYWLNFLKETFIFKSQCKRIDIDSNSLHESKFIALFYCLKNIE